MSLTDHAEMIHENHDLSSNNTHRNSIKIKNEIKWLGTNKQFQISILLDKYLNVYCIIKQPKSFEVYLSVYDLYMLFSSYIWLLILNIMTVFLFSSLMKKVNETT